MKNSKKILTKLEAIRGFAAVYTVLHHSFAGGLRIGNYDFSFLFRFGQEAVILFFILSGFVIQYAYLNSKDTSFKTFFRKRFLRIYIPIIIIFITNYGFNCIEFGGLMPINKWSLLGNILMLQDNSSLKSNVICDPFLGNAPLWSLSYEWWFYMLFFVLITRFTVNASKWVYAMGTLSTISYLIYPNFLNRELMYLIIWWIGADMARLYHHKMVLNFQNLKLGLGVLSLNALILLIQVKISSETLVLGRSPFLEFRHFAFSFLAIILALVWKKYHWIGFKYTLRLFEPMASISFGIYISHWFLITNAHYLDGVIENNFIRWIFYSLICVVFSFIVERIIYIKFNAYLIKTFYLSPLLKEKSKVSSNV